MADAKIILRRGERTFCLEIHDRGEPESLGLDLATILPDLDFHDSDADGRLLSRLMYNVGHPYRVLSVGDNPDTFTTDYIYDVHVRTESGTPRFDLRVSRRGDSVFSGGIREFVGLINPWSEGTLPCEPQHQLPDFLGEVPNFLGRFGRMISGKIGESFRGILVDFRRDVRVEHDDVIVHIQFGRPPHRSNHRLPRDAVFRVYLELLPLLQSCGLASILLDGGDKERDPSCSGRLLGGIPTWRGGDIGYLELSNRARGWRGSISIEHANRRLVTVEGRNATRFAVEATPLEDIQRLVEWVVFGIGE